MNVTIDDHILERDCSSQSAARWQEPLSRIHSADRGIRNEFFNDNMVDREIMINILVDGVS